MDKPLDLLEKHFQWGILGLGGAFLVFTSFQYVLTQPSVAVGGQSLSAGAIDRAIVGGPVRRLEELMNAPTPVQIAKPTFDDTFRMAMTGPVSEPLALGWTAARPLSEDLPIAGAPGVIPVLPPGGGVAAGVEGRVRNLAQLPAGTGLGTSQGRSQVNLAVIQPLTAMQVGPWAGHGAQPPAAGVPVAAAVDRVWVSGAWEIPVAEVARAMRESGVQPGLLAQFLRVEVERQEKQADGSWGPAVVIRPLANSALGRTPMPPAANPQQELMYRAWAEANQPEILQPGFYLVLGGSPWTPPLREGADIPTGPFDPSQYLRGPIPDYLTPEQRDAVRRARQEEAARRQAEERERRRQEAERGPDRGGWRGPGGPGRGGPGGGRGGGPGGGMGFFAPMFPSLFWMPVSGVGVSDTGAGVGVPGAWALPPIVQGLPLMQAAPGGGRGAPPRPPGLPPHVPWPPHDFDVPRGPPGGWFPPGQEFPGEFERQAPQVPQDPAFIDLGQLPTGPFDPATWAMGNIVTVQHDETVVPGRTYRYRMRYVLLNPLFQQPAIAAPELAAQFRWESEFSEWTDEVVIPEEVSFFVTSRITGGAATVQLEVFRFLDGRMRSRQFSVGPGDLIGSVDQGNDFSTGWLLLDIRRDFVTDTNYALVMGPDGTIVRRDESDAASRRFQQLREEARERPAVGAGR